MLNSKQAIRIFFLMLALFMGAASEVWSQEPASCSTANCSFSIATSDIKVTGTGCTVVVKSGDDGIVHNLDGGHTVKIVVTPAERYLISIENIKVQKLISPSRTRTPGIADYLTVIGPTVVRYGSSNNVFEFTVPAGYGGAYIEATFTETNQRVVTADIAYDPYGNYLLVEDITVSSSGNLFTFNNNQATPFRGTFVGQAKPDGTFPKIIGLKHALFNEISGGIVKNVNLQNLIISQAGPAGAIAGTATGYSLIYNCGILPSSNLYNAGTETSYVKSSGNSAEGVSDSYCGGLVGWLKHDSRVINCFSYANITGGTDVAGIVGHNEAASNTTVTDGKYANLRTAVVNCMFYGNISGGTNRYPVYGGAKMPNNTDTGINNYDFYRAEASLGLADNNHYNCSWPAEEKYLTQYEFHRNLLNSNRELCGWWVGAPSAPSTMSTADVQAVPKDASLMAKWVLDPSIAPYPILKSAGYYPSPVNRNPRPGETDPQRINPDTKKWVSRASSTNTEMKNPNDAPETDGRSLGTISVSIKKNSSATTSIDKDIIITAMDVDNNDFCYGKIQLPYYNSIYGDPTVQIDPTATAEQKAAQWNTRYGGNYGDNVVVGWEITGVTGGTPGTLVTKDNAPTGVNAWESGYNFADRNCTNKDKERVFAQGGYYYVPYGVSAITITAKWATAIYLDNGSDHSYDRVNFASLTGASAGTHFAPAGKRSTTLGNGKTVVTGNIKDNIPTGSSVYEKAIVLVGNHQYRVGGNNIGDGNGACTIMSADFDLDDEPDYSLIWQLGQVYNRQNFCPIRFDFLPVTELGMVMRVDASTQYFALGCYRPLGHFEMTETSLIHFGQFEFSNKSRSKYAPLILNGGIFDQYTKGTNNNAFSTADDKIDYIILGGNVRMPSFTPGAHVNTNSKFPTRHCAVNVMGGSIDNLYLTGNYNNGITPNKDNPHCYIDGGNFKQIAAAGKEGIDGDVYFNINHSIINEFYGGSTLSDKLVTGDIHVTIDNSYVTKYCGGPKFGNMNLSDSNPENNKTVTTNATGTTFGVYYGGGNGGTSYVQHGTQQDNTTTATGYNWNATGTNQGHVNEYSPRTYINKSTGYRANYEMEIVNVSTGTEAGKAVFRTYFYAAQFSATNTGPITNNLTDCKVLKNFYGGGNLGGVKGDVTSKLMGTTHVDGSVFGAGYSASIPEVTIYNRDKTPPTINIYTGIITPTPETSGTSTTYTWTHETSLGGQTLSKTNPTVTVGDKNYFYTEESLTNLGSITGNISLTLEGDATVEGKVFKKDGTEDTTKTGGVYGGGDESIVSGNTTVTLKDNATVNGNVFGGGNNGEVSGSATVNIED